MSLYIELALVDQFNIVKQFAVLFFVAAGA